MKRRNFLKSAAMLSTASLITPTITTATTLSQKPCLSDERRRFTLSQTYHVKAPEGSSGQVKLWIPLPVNSHLQYMQKIHFEGNYKDAYITADNSYAAKTLFAYWPDSSTQMVMTVEMVIETLDWQPILNGDLDSYRKPEKISYPIDVERYRQATAHMPTGGIVKETADKIIGTETHPLNQARLIYNWVSTNMFRDNSVIGCGTGDVASILESGKLGGKCTDINSVFVALCRAVGIPAREMFGLRLGKSIKLGKYSNSAFGSSDSNGLAKVSGGQHCKAQFYLAGYGWLPADPADVTKMRLTENKDNNHPDVEAVRSYLFGNCEMNWVGFNYGRDFDLSPEAEQTPINNFGYPYAEVDGDPVDYYNPDIFAYDYQSKEL